MNEPFIPTTRYQNNFELYIEPLFLIMKNRSFSQKVRAGIKPIADRMGIGDWLRQTYVETLMIGERAKFLLAGRPSAKNTILLAGSGRSGTTWIGDVICTLPGIQQIFEPLHPRFNKDVRNITGWLWEEQPNYHYFKSTYLHPEFESPEWTITLERALTGRSRNYFTDYVRTSYFPTRYLVKEIWANMMLGYIAKRFSPKIIYILRHPCAVIHSRMNVNWHANVKDILEQPQLVHDYLCGLVDEIRKETDVLGAHSVWWAVENRVALQQLKDTDHFIVHYEDIILHPMEVLENLLTWLGQGGLTSEMKFSLDKPSRTSNQQELNGRKLDRLSGWQNDFSAIDQERVLTWAERLGVNMYNSVPMHYFTPLTNRKSLH